jgi:hypothetical protein
MTQEITSVPPSEAPPELTDPGSGAFITEYFDVTGKGVDHLPEREKRFLGFMHATQGEPGETEILLKVNGVAAMWLDFWSKPDHLEQLAGHMDHLQDVIMETTHEQWPKCPRHKHALLPRPGGDWVEWQCPDTDEAIARFGQLSGVDSVGAV